MSPPDSSLDKPAAAPRGVFVQKPRANIYTALLVLSFLALSVGCAFLAGEMAMYDWHFRPTSPAPAGS